MRDRLWDATMTLAMLGLILFVWFELSNDIQYNAEAIVGIRVEIANMRAEIVAEISDTRAELIGHISELKAEMIRETHTNRERIYRLESRAPGGAP